MLGDEIDSDEAPQDVEEGIDGDVEAPLDGSDGEAPAASEGPEGEAHHGLVSVDGSTNRNIKISHLRNQHDKFGMELTQTESLSGFGFLHDGSIPSVKVFLENGLFSLNNSQELDVEAFSLAFPTDLAPIVGQPILAIGNVDH